MVEVEVETEQTETETETETADKTLADRPKEETHLLKLSYEEAELDVAAIKSFYLSDYVFISPKKEDYRPTSSFIYCPLLELRVAFLYYIGYLYEKPVSSRIYNEAQLTKLYVKGLEAIGLKKEYINWKLGRREKAFRLFHGAEVKTAYIFGMKIKLLDMLPEASNPVDAMKILSEKIGLLLAKKNK